MSKTHLKPCIFFDRDGVINRSPGKGYVLCWDQFEFNDGIIDAIKWVKEKNLLVILITSQRGVGKGLMSAADLLSIHSKMQDHLSEHNATFDAIYAYTESFDCPHQAKPDPEMILSAAKEYNLDLERCWMIGDSDRDIVMGRAAHLKGCIRFLSDKLPEVEADHTVKNALDLKHLLEKIL